MSKSKFTTERKWELGKHEIKFEKLLKENNFNILGWKEYVSKTVYLVEKDDCIIEVELLNDSRIKVNDFFKSFVRSWEIKKKYDSIKSLL